MQRNANKEDIQNKLIFRLNCMENSLSYLRNRLNLWDNTKKLQIDSYLAALKDICIVIENELM